MTDVVYMLTGHVGTVSAHRITEDNFGVWIKIHCKRNKEFHRWPERHIEQGKWGKNLRTEETSTDIVQNWKAERKKEREGKNDNIQGFLENDKAQSILNENTEEKRKSRETERRMEGEKTHTDCHMAVAVSSFPIGQYCFLFPGVLTSIVRLLDSDKSELVSQRSCNFHTSLGARSIGNNRKKSPMLSMTGTKTQPQSSRSPVKMNSKHTHLHV